MRAALAFLLNLNVALYFVTGQPFYQNGSPLSHSRLGQFGPNPLYRMRRDNNKLEERVIDFETDCMLVTSDEGSYFYKSPSDDSTVCGIYFVADAGKKIEISFSHFDVPCENSGLVAWIDGWELNGQFFPSPRDHPKAEDDRFAEFCGVNSVKNVLISSQNAAMMQYRVPAKGKGFTITVHHVKNFTPCNILLYDMDDTYTIRNYGKTVNCSLSTIYPASIQVLDMSVGALTNPWINIRLETGTFHGCKKLALRNYVEIGGALGMDNAHLETADTICGTDSMPAKAKYSIKCEVTTVRLVSSGRFDNSITVKIGKLDPKNASFVCNKA